MGTKTLGIDIGTNSIGWALVEEHDQDGGSVIDMGVRVFPEGVDRDQNGGEKSKNETRRVARSSRRQIARRSKRKKRLKKLLSQHGLYPVDIKDRKELLEKDPYLLRERALNEPLSLHEIGRALTHLNQRRGFKSNRKTDKSQKKQKSKILNEINELAARMHEGGFETLGEYLSNCRKNGGEITLRVRNQHTRREMYEHEFDAIWQAQQPHHPEVMTEGLKKEIRETIFFQRPMYWPKEAIGRCELEPKEFRCPRCDRQGQRFRLWKEINNLRIVQRFGAGDELELTPEQKQELIQQLEKSQSITVERLRQCLQLEADQELNITATKSKLLGMESDAILSKRKYFGNKWNSFSDEIKDQIIWNLHDNEIKDDEVTRKAVQEWGVDQETADELLTAPLPEGYFNFSRKAIDNMLPHIMEGEDEFVAMEKAGYLPPHKRKVPIREYLPSPPDLPNPIVRQALFEFRKLVNAILREYGKPDAIHIELARKVKASQEKRQQLLTQNRERAKEREAAKEDIVKEGHSPNQDTINLYMLWKEQGGLCIYSGQPISKSQLLMGEVNIDHILPKDRSLDDSLANKVVCFRSENAEKGDRTPREWLEDSNPDKLAEIQQRAWRLPRNKQKKFAQRDIQLDDFINRQLSDTGYISREIRKYVECLGADVVCTKGQNTSDLRRYWGLNSILNLQGKNIKTREDHRHHAVDALVVALTTRSKLQQLARASKRKHDSIPMPEPWPGFRGEVEEKVNRIWVSHRVRRKVRGQLHEETHYGPTEEQNVYVYRKSIEDLTPSMVEDIRDETIKQLVKERLAQFGLDEKSKKIPKEVWKEPLTMPSGVPIKKVRVKKNDSTIQPIRDGSVCVKTGSNHHICLFTRSDGSKDMVAVSMLEAHRRKRDGKPIIQREHPDDRDATFEMSLSINEMVMINGDLYRFLTASSVTGQFWMRHHTFAGKSNDKRMRISKVPSTFNGKKVTVDVLGRIRDAND